MVLNICFDLGNDTMKIVYAYKDGSDLHFGKFNSTAINQSAIPANAYYDEDNDKWYFGNDIDLVNNESFITVVKIKQLLLLLQMLDKSEKEIEKQNNDFYFSGNDFPKFYFPYHFALNNKNDFQERKDNEMTFTVHGVTPQKICEQYFQYVKKIVEDKVFNLVQEQGLRLRGIEFSLVYPSKVGDKYVDEYTRLIKTTFGEPKTVISSVKAVSMYAYHLRYFNSEEPILFFDMGENDISVAKAKVISDAGFNGVVIDAQDGHLLPIEIGGDDIDSAIVQYLEGTIERRETIGSPAYGELGHIMEKGLHSKQYLLMKNVKKAKMILSKVNHRTNLFDNGVPITIVRDVIVQRNLTKEELKECIGITNNDGVARKIVDFILEEYQLKINNDVRTIIISGGLIETYGLFEYIEQEVKKVNPNISIYTLESKSELAEAYPIKSFEDSTFAACLGGVMVNLMKYQLKMCLARSYGTWGTVTNPRTGFSHKFLSIFAEKGKIISGEGEEVSVSFTFSGASIKNDEFFSIDVKQSQILRKEGPVRYYEDDNRRVFLLVGEEDNRPEGERYRTPNQNMNEEYQIRENVKKVYGLKVVTGGKDGEVLYYYKGKRVFLNDKISAYEGVYIDKNGYCNPYIKNNIQTNGNRIVNIYYLRQQRNGYGELVYDQNKEPILEKDFSVGLVNVYAKDIVFVFKGFNNFGTQED